MRDIGRSLSDRGYLEVDTVTGTVTWANEYLLKKHGYSLSQAQSMTLFDMVPEEFHDPVRNTLADIQAGKGFKFAIRPIVTADGKLVWWYSVRVKTQQPYTWFRSEYLNTTERSGPEYASMAAAMQTTNSYNDLYNRVQELQLWTEEAVERLDKKDAELEDKVHELAEEIRQTKKFAETAANASLEFKQAMVNFQAHVAEEISKQTTEILRLISTDALHDKRMETFEKHVKEATSTAMRAITVKANEAGSSLTKKVTVPVGTIAAIATIIQWVMQHWPHH